MQSSIDRWRADFLASIVVFLVALPLSLGIALASGAPIMAGVIGAIIGGIVIGSIAGAPLQVSGPAAGLTVLVFGYIKDFGFEAACAITVVAGLIQIAGGVARVAKMAMAISPAVIHGMLAGIGVVIALAQIHIVLGGSPESSPVKNIIELPLQVMELHGPATLLGMLTIGVLIGWTYIPVKSLKLIPAPLVAVLTGTIASIVMNADVKRVELGGGLLDAFHLPQLPETSKLATFAIAAVTMAIVASAESLLCAVATDKLHSGPRANLNRELLAQGIGNTLSGLVGGLPVTGVIVRSTANIMAGGKTRWSAILHGVWVLVFVLFLGSLISKVPLAVLAALLVYVGVKLVNIAHIKDLLKHHEASIYFVTVAGIVGVNLLAGIGIGFALAIARLLYRLAAVKITIETKGDTHLVVVTGALTFLGVPRLLDALDQLPIGKKVDVDLAVSFIDHAGLEAIHSWQQAYEKTGGSARVDELADAFRINTKKTGT